MQFLKRRLNLADVLLHRWIRTGQIRLNGKRCKPFSRIANGDLIRLPPFIWDLTEKKPFADTAEKPEISDAELKQRLKGFKINYLDRKEDVLAIVKPAGLPTHAGSLHTAHSDSLKGRLSACFENSAFCPSPVHRLDKDTSGIILSGLTYNAQKRLHEQFKTGNIIKEYLAEVRGQWPYKYQKILQHYLVKGRDNSKADRFFEKMKIVGTNRGKKAICVVKPLITAKNKSLVQIRLITGITHQIRVQLTACGHPVIGDGKYGEKGDSQLKLHAFRVILPNFNNYEFLSFPDWLKNWPAENPQTFPEKIETGFA